MSAEAEKVISLSLCKMAETRGPRRGSTSLHKHLLIASVLNKATRARSAFLDTWYMGDDGSNEAIDMNMSYQEAEFPADELDSSITENVELIIDQAARVTGVDAGAGSTEVTFPVPEPRRVTEPEGEIDLPPDILSCVEKLGDLNERIFSPSTETSASSSNSSVATISNTSTQAHVQPNASSLPDVISTSEQAISEAEGVLDDSQISSTLTYLDLDAGSSTVIHRGPAATSTPSKRRREWCFEDEDEDDVICGSSGLLLETPDKSQSKEENTVTFRSCKRLRFDDDSGVSSPTNSFSEETRVPSTRASTEETSFKAGSFRLTYDDEDRDDSDDDSFLEDALSQGLPSPTQIQMAKTRHRNDRRVPSASSSGSCSDEDVDESCSMEVDQLTNLVQFISFNKQQQNQAQNTAGLRSISCVN